MKKLLLFSGLGADKRVFDFLDLTDYELHHIIWITPIPKESLSDYAKRLLPQIFEVKPILMGVSFGGMIAQEIAKLIAVEKIILISSAQAKTAIPPYLKLMSKLNIQKLLPRGAFRKPNEVLFWLFGITLHKHKVLLTSIMADTDETFFTWAIETIPKWNNKPTPKYVVQIHGSSDKILSLQTADYIVEGGGHLMIVTHATEISSLIKSIVGESRR